MQAGPKKVLFNIAPSELFLDSLTPGLVYSLRKVVKAYAGACVRIRASGDDAETDIAFNNGVVDSAAVLAHIAAHGGSPFITKWYDQGGGAADAVQATTANQPAFIAAGINGKPTAQFDGTNDNLATAGIGRAAICGANEVTIFAILDQDAAQTNNTLLYWTPDGDVTRLNCHPSFGDQLYFDFGDTGSGRVNAAQPANWDTGGHVLEMYRTTGDVQAIFSDGALVVSSGSHTAQPSGVGTGAFVLGGLTSQFAGYMSSFFTLKTDVGLAARTIIRANQGAFYGINVV